jgi:hypothetical protein
MVILKKFLGMLAHSVRLGVLLFVSGFACAGPNVWTGPWPSATPISDMQVVSSTGLIYAVSNGGLQNTLYVSSDGGVSWVLELVADASFSSNTALGVDL